MNQLMKVTLSDFKLIFRDPSLRIFLLLPGIIFLVVLFAIPPLIDRFPVVADYLTPLLIVCTIELTQTFSVIYSMMLIDEKETEVSKVYGVLPVSKSGFTFARLVIPIITTAFLVWALLLVQPFYEINIFAGLLLSLLLAFIVPVYILGVSILSKNKMQGLVWIKVFNVVVLIPIIAFFVPKNLSYAFAAFPTHWPFQSLNQLMEGKIFTLGLILGFVYFFLLLFFELRKFSKTHFA